MKTLKPFLSTVFVMTALTACAPQQASPDALPSETTQVTTSAPESASATPSQMPAASAALGSPDTTPTPETSSESKTATLESDSTPLASESLQSAPLSESSAGTTLSLSAFARHSDGWSDGSYAIADEAGITGIGAELSRCTSAPKYADMGDSFNYEVETLRLNLGQKFDKLNFKAGQDLNSDVMDRTISYRVTDGKQQIGDIHTVSYDEISSLEIDVSGQSVIFIQVYASSNNGESCGSNSVTAVMYDITLD